MSPSPSLLRDVKALYATLPEVSCIGCGQCCVSPTCTLVEFIYLMCKSIEHYPSSFLDTIILANPVINQNHDGNLSCIMLNKQKCSIHPWRTGACRLFGIPAVEHLGISNLVTCYNNIKVVGKPVDEPFVQNWLAQIVAFNEKLYPFNQDPYYIVGFNIECWLDIYFDETISEDAFLDVQKIMRNNFDLSSFSARYKPKTRLKEKIDKISLLYMMLDIGDKATLKDLVLSIQNDYPLTGTYFDKEAETFLEALNNMP